MAEKEGESNQVGNPNATGESQIWMRRIIRILSIVILVIALLIGMSYVAYRVAQNVQKKFNSEDEIIGIDALPPNETFEFSEEFRVNTANSEASHFIRAQISLAYRDENPEFATELRLRRLQMRNLINLILMSKTKEQLRDVESRILLQEEIRAAINHILINGKINDIYFTSFLLN